MTRRSSAEINQANAARVAAIKAELSREERRRRAAPAMLAALRGVLQDPGSASLSAGTVRDVIAAVKEAE